MNIIFLIIFGLIVGLITHLFAKHTSLLVALIFGIVGSLSGGILASVVFDMPITAVNFTTLLIALLGAQVLINSKHTFLD